MKIRQISPTLNHFSRVSRSIGHLTRINLKLNQELNSVCKWSHAHRRWMNRSAANERLNGRLMSREIRWLFVHQPWFVPKLSTANDQMDLMTGGRRWKSTQVKGERPRLSQGSLRRPRQENFQSFYSLPLWRIPRLFWNNNQRADELHLWGISQ